MAAPPSRSNSASSSGGGVSLRAPRDPKQAGKTPRSNGGGGGSSSSSRVFVMFASLTVLVGIGNIAYHHAIHDDADIARVAEELFRANHFRTVKEVAGGAVVGTDGAGAIGGAPADAESGRKAAVGNDNARPAAAANPNAASTPGAHDGHAIAGLSCSRHGGPPEGDPAADEMVYWRDISSDSDYRSPFHPATENGEPERYVTFEPDHGGWNNIRMAMETVLVLAHAMGRTLVLPPRQGMYLLRKGDKGQKNTFSFSDFFHLDSIASEHSGFKVITMDEFLTREAAAGKLKGGKKPPGDQVDWNGKSPKALYGYLKEVGEVPLWNPHECVAAIPASSDPKDAERLQQTMEDIMKGKKRPKPKVEDFVGKPTSVDASAEDRLGEILGERTQICLYTPELQQAHHIHFMVDKKAGTRLLTHFYSFVFFQDWRADLWSKRFVRDHVRYIDEIFCAAARIVGAVRERARKKGGGVAGGNGIYDSFHVRRGDFQYKKVKVDAPALYEKSREELTEGATLYIATDERDKSFFKPLAEHYDVTYLDDYAHLIEGMNTNYYGMLDQLVATRGRVFFGTWFSTLSGYVNRMRGYDSAKRRLPGYRNGTIASYYFVPEDRKYHMTQYRPVKLPLYMQEFPTAWRDIDRGVKEIQSHRKNDGGR